MFTDLTGETKDGIVRHLSASPRVTGFVPPERIYAMQVPSDPIYPFIRYGTPIPTPFLSSCWSGTSSRITIDIFTQGIPQGESGEVQATRLLRLVVEAMNNLRLPGGPALLDNEYLGARVTQVSPEADLWRAAAEFNVTAVVAA